MPVRDTQRPVSAHNNRTDSSTQNTTKLQVSSEK